MTEQTDDPAVAQIMRKIEAYAGTAVIFSRHVGNKELAKDCDATYEAAKAAITDALAERDRYRADAERLAEWIDGKAQHVEGCLWLRDKGCDCGLDAALTAHEASAGMTTTTIRFTVPGLAPASASPNGRAHYLRKHADGKAYGETVYLIIVSELEDEGPPWERAHVTVTQKAVRLRDHDNFAASFKPGLDAIVRADIIVDDKPSVIDLSLRAVAVKHKIDECVEVCIERME